MHRCTDRGARLLRHQARAYAGSQRWTDANRRKGAAAQRSAFSRPPTREEKDAIDLAEEHLQLPPAMRDAIRHLMIGAYQIDTFVNGRSVSLEEARRIRNFIAHCFVMQIEGAQ